jgi:16S rRNA G966 N2-methylase RsmD
MKEIKQSPLPFQGQKRNFVRHFKNELEKHSSNATYVDLFGGSGLLSHTVKSHYPNARVIYNDYDNFKKRVDQIPQTNALLSELRVVLAGLERKSKITEPYKSRVIELLRDAEKNGYSDWITISSNLLFSMNYRTSLNELVKETMYNKVRLSNYNAEGYLDGVEVVSEDYQELFKQYSSTDNVIFLVDPPYLSTDSSTYNSDSYWKLRDYLDVLQVLHGNDYFYFTSNKSQIVELCEWVSSVSAAANPFNGATVTSISTNTSHNSGYTDIMYSYKK